jgi:periplasmic mercuric ion binding protein
MKAISLSVFSLFCFISLSFGQYQQTQKAVGKAVIKTPTVLCDKCRDKVEFFISHTEGVTSVKANTRQKTTTVTWLNDRTTLENIKVAIANLGYDADDIEAEEYAYKRLPKDCKIEIEAAKAKAAAAANPPAKQ